MTARRAGEHLQCEFCRDEGCFTAPRRFDSPHTRFIYFRSEGRHPDVEAWDDTRSEIRIVYIKVPRETLQAQNRAREAAVPWAVISKMADRWEVPSLLEAHELSLVVR